MTSASCLTVLGLFYFQLCSGTEIADKSLHREKRQLLFPNSTLLQFNVGIGTPSPAALINVNWAFQANFQLPWNRSQIPFDILETDSTYSGLSRKKRGVESEYENDARLYHLYQYVEGILNGFGHNGTICVLRTLCEIGFEPLHCDDEEDLLHELASFALNPRNDAEHIAYKEEIRPYIEAYEYGENHQNCTKLYENCKISLLNLFTKLYDDEVDQSLR